MDPKSALDWIVLLTPLTTGFVSGWIVGDMSESAVDVNARPPGWVFGVVWSILYLMIGFAWVTMRREGKWINILMMLLVASLVAWLFIYDESEQSGLYAIVFTILFAMLVFTYTLKSSDKKYTPYLIVPLIVWLLFATMLNFEEVNNL